METIRPHPILARLARALTAFIFIVSGTSKITDWSGASQYMASQGMRLIPFFLVAAIVVELGAGLMLLLGIRERLAAALLFLYLIPVTLVFHHFWTLTGSEATMQTVYFLKNAAIAGGLLAMAVEAPIRIPRPTAEPIPKPPEELPVT